MTSCHSTYDFRLLESNMKKPLLLLVFVTIAAVPMTWADQPGSTATGIVYLDQNNNQVLDTGDTPLAGVKVSNGRQITTTDDEGRYQLSVDNDDILFVVKPRGMRTPLSKDMLPQFYYIHKPQGSPTTRFPGVPPTGPLPDSINFPLYKQSEPKQFRAVLFGDTQPRNQKEVDYIAHDVVEELIGTNASFGVTLGDVVFDDLMVFNAINQTIGLIGIPWYNVIGNHDLNFDAKQDHHSDETFESIYGPAYYSFDYGPVHFLVLDDVEWFIPEENGAGTYRGGFGKEQMEFIRNDLAMIPEKQLVVLLMHIPLVDVHDRQELYRLIEKRPFCMSVSGHTHTHEHRYITKEDGWLGPQPHHHVINVTVSGSWWSGLPDERGIPHTIMADGAPNGYSIISFDGASYQLDFKAAGRSAEYQMQIHAPEVVAVEKLPRTTVYVNVFNGSERTQVEMCLGTGQWISMDHTREIDPGFQKAFDADAAIWNESRPWRKMPTPRESTHLWKAQLPAGTQTGTLLLRVRSTDDKGRTDTSQRVIRVVQSSN